MATKKDKLSYIESLNPEEILKLIPHDVMNKLVVEAGAVKAYTDNASDHNVIRSGQPNTQDHTALQTSRGSSTAATKAMRPLNAFIAFRSYYKTMFHGVQQKDISSYLTLLWVEDPFRNKWALVAKVYSFIRDEVGKSQARLGDFLAVACPLMGIIEPTDYLRLLGWVQAQGESGNSMISQDKSISQATIVALEDHQHPNTELELLVGCIRTGYLACHGNALTTKIASKSNAIMTPSSAPSNDGTIKVSKVFDAVFSDSLGAAAELLGLYRDNEIFDNGINILTMDQDIQRSKASVAAFMSGPYHDSIPSAENMTMGLLREPMHSPAISVHNLPIDKTYDMRDVVSVEEFVKDNNQGYHDNLFWGHNS